MYAKTDTQRAEWPLLNKFIRAVTSAGAILRGVTRRIDAKRRLVHQTRGRGKVKFVKTTSRLPIKYLATAEHVAIRNYRRAARGLCAAVSWKAAQVLTFGRRAGRKEAGVPFVRSRAKVPSRRDVLRAAARSHQATK